MTEPGIETLLRKRIAELEDKLHETEMAYDVEKARAEVVRKAAIRACAQIGCGEHEQAHLTLHHALKATGKGNVKLATSGNQPEAKVARDG